MLETGQPFLPNNENGYRTTHTCELCGFEPKTKNKYREKQDHMVMKHFKEKIDKIFPSARPYTCPTENCPFLGKDKQALLRHYTGKHGILEKYLKEALAEKGIHYIPGESNKRRHPTGGGETDNPSKMVKVVQLGDHPTVKSNNEDLCREVEAMMASFQPQPYQGTQFVVLPQNTQLVTVPFQSLQSSQPNGTVGTFRLSLPQTPVSVSLPSFSQSQTVTTSQAFFTASSLPRLIMPGLPTEPLPLQVVSGHSGGIVTTTSHPLNLCDTKIPLETFNSGKFEPYPANPGGSPLKEEPVELNLPNLVSHIEKNATLPLNQDGTLSNRPLPSFSSQNLNHEVLLDSFKTEDGSLVWTHDPDANLNVDCAGISYNPEDDGATFNPGDFETLMGQPDDDGVQERQLDFYMM